MGILKSKHGHRLDGEVNINHFKVLRTLGKGSFGKVCIVTKRDSKAMYAMKYVNKDLCVKDKAVRNILQERIILGAIKHPLIVNLQYAFQDDENLYMVMDLMMGGDLRYHLSSLGPVSEQRLKQYAAELSCVLLYLHGLSILHRDIKPDNVLMDAQGHLHLADFNVAAFILEGKPLVNRAGTRPYMAPEMVARKGYSYGADWWSLGVTLLELLSGKNPFKEKSTKDIEEAILNRPVTLPSTLSKQGRDFLSGLLERNPDVRLGQKEGNLRAHPFFTSASIDVDKASELNLKPIYVPEKNTVNFDAIHEVEELMLEQNPVFHKKARRRRSREFQGEGTTAAQSNEQREMKELSDNFVVFDRDKSDMPNAPIISAKDILLRARELQYETLPSDLCLNSDASTEE